jgi:putative salt-induced outer membrane protein
MKNIFKIIVVVISYAFSDIAFAQEAKSPFTNESQAAIVQTTGNSETESFSLKQANTYVRDLNTFKVNASYLKTETDDVETARKWDAGTRAERSFAEKWSGFVGYLLESDKYAGYDQRHNTDFGGKYIILKKENYDLLSEAGYRYVHQNNVNNSQIHYNAARLYLENNYRFNETNSTKLWAEYIPNFDESKDYQLNWEASVSSALSSIFSLKVAYNQKTDNLPETGKDKTDTTLTTALVAKF